MSYRYAIRTVVCGFFLCAIALPAKQVPGRSPQKRMSSHASTSASCKKSACILVTTAEIEAVQGEPVKETRASVHPNGEMLISGCLFQTTNFAKSVSVALATPSSAKLSAFTPRKFWQKQFHAPDVEEDKMRAAGKKAQKRSEEHTSELQSPDHLVCRLLLEKKNNRR